MRRTPNPKVGEVWDVDFSPQIGHEQGGTRPALVISNERFNNLRHQLRFVAPFTGTNRGVPSHVSVEPPAGGLTKPSVIMCEQAKSQSLLRFRRKRGDMDAETVEAVQEMVRRLLTNARNTSGK